MPPEDSFRQECALSIARWVVFRWPAAPRNECDDPYRRDVATRSLWRAHPRADETLRVDAEALGVRQMNPPNAKMHRLARARALRTCPHSPDKGQPACRARRP